LWNDDRMLITAADKVCWNLFSISNHVYADRNDIQPFNKSLPFGVIEYRLFLIGFIVPFFAGMSILSTYPSLF